MPPRVPIGINLCVDGGGPHPAVSVREADAGEERRTATAGFSPDMPLAPIGVDSGGEHSAAVAGDVNLRDLAIKHYKGYITTRALCRLLVTCKEIHTQGQKCAKREKRRYCMLEKRECLYRLPDALANEAKHQEWLERHRQIDRRRMPEVHYDSDDDIVLFRKAIRPRPKEVMVSIIKRPLPPRDSSDETSSSSNYSPTPEDLKQGHGRRTRPKEKKKKDVPTA